MYKKQKLEKNKNKNKQTNKHPPQKKTHQNYHLVTIPWKFYPNVHVRICVDVSFK